MERSVRQDVYPTLNSEFEDSRNDEYLTNYFLKGFYYSNFLFLKLTLRIIQEKQTN